MRDYNSLSVPVSHKNPTEVGNILFKSIISQSKVFEISHVTGTIHQSSRSNHHPSLVLITRENYRGELRTKLKPGRLQSPVFREFLISFMLLSYLLSAIIPLFLCFISVSLFSSVVSPVRTASCMLPFGLRHTKTEDLNVKTCVVLGPA